MNLTRRVVVSGIGVVSPFGIGRDLFWEELHRGISASRWITTFDTSGMPVRFWANVPETEDELTGYLINKKSGKLLTRSSKMSLIAAGEAVTQSGIDFHELPDYRAGICVGASGSSQADIDEPADEYHRFEAIQSGRPADIGDYWEALMQQTHPLLVVKSIPNAISAHLSILYQIRGNCLTVSTACTSSSQAIGEAYNKIKFGLNDVILAGGADSVTNPHNLISFGLLGVLSTNNDQFLKASRPFDRDRDGFMLGEGAAFFVLEELEHCKKRGGIPLAELSGFGCASDAYRVTDEPEDARGSIAAMQLALADAGLNPDDISYINAHGTSTRMNDKIETYAIKQVFGDAAFKIPVSSNKSMIGHLIAGAGAIELAASVLSMNHHIIPPTINLENPGEGCDLDYVPGVARDADLTHILSNSFGFGGQNSCLIINKI